LGRLVERSTNMDALRDTWRRVVLRQPQQLYSLAVRCTRAAARALARPAPGLALQPLQKMLHAAWLRDA
jgi:hypothetical protein